MDRSAERQSNQTGSLPGERDCRADQSFRRKSAYRASASQALKAGCSTTPLRSLHLCVKKIKTQRRKGSEMTGLVKLFGARRIGYCQYRHFLCLDIDSSRQIEPAGRGSLQRRYDRYRECPVYFCMCMNTTHRPYLRFPSSARPDSRRTTFGGNTGFPGCSSSIILYSLSNAGKLKFYRMRYDKVAHATFSPTPDPASFR